MKYGCFAFLISPVVGSVTSTSQDLVSRADYPCENSRMPKDYTQIMHDAVDSVFIAAVRQGVDTRHLKVEFDAGLGAGPHPQHTLTISVRDNPSLVVTGKDIPHEWLPMATGFIDVRFSRLASGLIAELVKKAHESGRLI
jgi:hypothetical protein